MKKLAVIILVLATLIFTFVGVKPKTTPDLQVAAASNFAPFLNTITEDVQKHCQFKMQVSSGSTGMLTTQILNGAPFDIFFSADEARPAMLAQQGKAMFRQTYAIGRLVYWQPSLKNPNPDDPRPLAMADPKLAPFGQAAMQSLTRLRQQYDLPNDTVWGRNAGQVFQFVATGAAQAGLVPLSLVRLGSVSEGEYFIIPQNWHKPVRQDVAVLRQSSAVNCLIEFLQIPRIKTMMLGAGYEAES